MTITACVCVVAGAAAAGIYARDMISMIGAGDSQPVAPIYDAPVSNSVSKEDKLPVAAALMASLESRQGLRQAVGPEYGADQDLQANAPVAIPAMPAARPKSASKSVQKNYSLLSDAQIDALKGRLKLTTSQEVHWPAVENALRNVARKIHDNRQAKPASNAPPINPDSVEVQQLKAAAMPLLFQLREDQKREVRALARVIGLDQVASQI